MGLVLECMASARHEDFVQVRNRIEDDVFGT